MEDNLKEQLKQLENTKENLVNFVNTLTKQLPKEDRDRLEKEMKTINIKDISPSVAKINEEISAFLKKSR